jgi:SAM-dependent methyltransferase
MTAQEDPKRRFSNRVEDYIRYRPGYPPGVLDPLRGDCGLAPESVIADIGSGTGLLARVFLENGNLVYGVEPNAEMREAGERLLKEYPRFRSVAGSAEATTLADASADFVAAGQAFHWFEPHAARAEFRRLLKPAGWIAVIWNERKKDGDAFQREYEALLQEFGTDYEQVAATYPTDERVETFFGAGGYRKRMLSNEQRLDFDGLRGRLLSSSYTPAKGHRKHEPMLAELRRIFDAHAGAGRVRIEYDTRVYYGRL